MLSPAKPLCLLLLSLHLLLPSAAVGQRVGINAPDPHSSAAFEVRSDSLGFLPPRLTQTQRNAIPAPEAGLVIYNTSTHCLEFFNGTEWISTCASTAPCVTPPTPTAGSNTPVCEGQSLQLTASEVAGATYIWTGPNDFYATEQNPVLTDMTSDMAGEYSLRVFLAGCYSDAVQLEVAYVPSPWEAKEPFPGPARSTESQGFAAGGRAFMGMGDQNGCDSPFLTYTDFWEYNPATDNWTARANFIGNSRRGMAAFSIADTGYIVAGLRCSVAEYNQLVAYDITTDTWSFRNNYVQTRRRGISGAMLDDIGYYGHGNVGSACPNNLIHQYDPAADSWTAIAAFPGTVARRVLSFAIDGRLFVGAGQNCSNNAALDQLYAYDPNTNTWAAQDPYPVGGQQLATFVIGNYAYTLPTNGSVWRFDPTAASGSQWSRLPCDYPSTYSSNVLGFAVGGSAYIFNLAGARETWEFTP